MATRGAFAVVVTCMIALVLPATASADESHGRDGLALASTAATGAMAPTVDGTGSTVAFHSEQGFLVAGDSNGFSDIFVRDRGTGELRLISKPPDTQANGGSSHADISADGRFVVFHSEASNLVAADYNERWDVFIADRVFGTIRRVSETALGGGANGSSFHPTVSDDGRFVAFHSEATNLAAGDTDTGNDVYVKDLLTGAVELVSVGVDDTASNGDAFVPDISGDGSVVAFESAATNLVVGDGNGRFDVFVRDLTLDTTERISVATGGGDAAGHSFLPHVSADGNVVAFESYAPDLVAGDANSVADVFVRDRALATTTLASVPFAGPANDRSRAASVSADGTLVVFQSWASNLVAGDSNDALDVFVHDLGEGTTRRLSATDGTGGDGVSALPAISDDGAVTVFESLSSNLVADDGDGFWDALAADTATGTLTPMSPVGTATADDVWILDASNPFVDVDPGAYYADGVSFLFANGITTGTAPTLYSPDAAVTRGQMATFLFRFNGSQWTIMPQPFTDVYGGTYFFEPVKWASDSEITTGTTATTFSPHDSVTRAQMATFLWRLAGEPSASVPHRFDDVATGAYYAEAVAWLKEVGISTGTSSSTFSPNNAVTRAQMAAFILRMAQDFGWTPTWAPVA